MKTAQAGFYGSIWYGIMLAAAGMTAFGPFVILCPRPGVLSIEFFDGLQLLSLAALLVMLLSYAGSRSLHERRTLFAHVYMALAITLTTFLTMRLLNELGYQTRAKLFPLLSVFDGESGYDPDFYESLLAIWLAIAASVTGALRLRRYFVRHRS